jgi:hypothetical protein
VIENFPMELLQVKLRTEALAFFVAQAAAFKASEFIGSQLPRLNDYGVYHVVGRLFADSDFHRVFLCLLA